VGWPPPYGANVLLDYLTDRDRLLIMAQGADGCGGSGGVWLVGPGGIKETVVELGIGCVAPEDPRYVSYRGGKLILARTRQNEELFPNGLGTEWGEIYEQDVRTGEQRSLIESSKIPGGIEKIGSVEGKKDKSVLTSWGGRVIAILDWTTLEIEEK